ncbi:MULTISPECIES: hypothetical protein [unclassified Saccharothrix]|uniref:hypothetical protein n=1 Tax=unclassified Saccharothrix TaxID=2593673 RepID=UPI00307EF63B
MTTTVRTTRLLSGVLGALLAATTLATPATAAPTPPAPTTAAVTSDSTVGGPITRSEILRRAQHWVDQQYTYGTLRCCPDANGDRRIVSTETAPDSSGKAYRTDCSGLVAMAWHLNNSPTSSEFMNGTNVGRTVLPSLRELKPGDAIVKNGHIELFSHWAVEGQPEQGAYVYSFNSYGETVRNPYAVTGPYTDDYGNYHPTGRLGFNKWNDDDPMTSYTPIRYNNVVDDDLPTQSSGSVVYNGTLYEFARGSDGTVKYWFGSGGPWSGVQSFGGGIASEPVATVYNGVLYVFAIGTDGMVKYWFASGGAWSSTQSVGGSASGGLSATVFNGTLYLFARGTDGMVKYWFGSGGPWSSAQTIGGSVSGPLASAVHNGSLYVFAVGTDGTVKYWFASGGPWSTTQVVGSAVSGGLSSTVYNGTLYLFARGTDGTVKYWFGSGGPWSSAQTVGGPVSGGVSSAVFNGVLYTFGRTSDGGVKYWFASGGPWSSMQTLA